MSAAITESSSVRAGGILSYLRALPRFAELYFEGRKTRTLVTRLRLPMIVVNSEYDETVSAKSLRYVEQMPNVRILTARASGHFYYPKETKELLSDALLHFIGRLTETNEFYKLNIYST